MEIICMLHVQTHTHTCLYIVPDTQLIEEQSLHPSLVKSCRSLLKQRIHFKLQVKSVHIKGFVVPLNRLGCWTIGL